MSKSGKAVLAQIDELLRALGASKSNLLTARVLLPDLESFEARGTSGSDRKPSGRCASRNGASSRSSTSR